MQPAGCLLALRASLPHVEAARAQRLGQGWDTWTFLTDNGLACRFPKTSDAAAALVRTAALLPRLASRLPLAIPEYSERGEWNGRPFVTYMALPGRPLVEWLQAGGSSDSCAPALGELVAALHATPLSSLGNAAPLEPLAWNARCLEATAAARAHLVPMLDEVAAARLLSTTGQLDAALQRRTDEDTLLHGDLTLLNLLADPRSGELTGLIDFDDTTIGDAAFDLRILASELPAPAFDMLLTAYGSGATSAFRERVALYARLAPIIDALERMASGDEVTARALVATWADAPQSSTLSLSSPQ